MWEAMLLFVILPLAPAWIMLAVLALRGDE